MYKILTGKYDADVIPKMTRVYTVRLPEAMC